MSMDTSALDQHCEEDDEGIGAKGVLQRRGGGVYGDKDPTGKSS